MSDEIETHSPLSPPDPEAGSSEAELRNERGQFVKGGAGGPGRPKTIHGAPLFEKGDEASVEPTAQPEAASELTPGYPDWAREAVERLESDHPSNGSEPGVAGPNIPLNFVCPPLPPRMPIAMEFGWQALARRIQENGDRLAFSEMLGYIEKYGDPDDLGRGGSGREYDGLPDEVVTILAELDTDLFSLLRRDQLKLPVSDIERACLNVLQAIQLHGPRSVEASYWADLVIRELHVKEAAHAPAESTA